MLGRAPFSGFLGGAAPAGCSAQRRSPPGPQGAGGRRLGLPRSRPGQPSAATATGTTTHGQPGYALDGPGQAVSTRPTTRGHRPTGHRGHRGQCPGVGGLSVGHGPRGSGDTVRPTDRWPWNPRPQTGCHRAVAEAPPRCGVTLGRGQRRREDTRAARAAGPRRMHVRWEPPHGEPPEHPAALTGSAAAAAPRPTTIVMPCHKLRPTLDLGSHRNARHQARREAEATSGA